VKGMKVAGERCELRLDLFLKRCGILKRRTWAQEACERGMVFVDGRKAKPSTSVRPGQRVLLDLVDRTIEVEVLDIPPKAPAREERERYYRILSESTKAFSL